MAASAALQQGLGCVVNALPMRLGTPFAKLRLVADLHTAMQTPA